jgi:uncharacterized membrane protein SirB2
MPYIAYLHTHVFLVVLYTIIFVVKLVFLLAGWRTRLEAFRRRTRVVEMFLPALFLFTGIMLAIKSTTYADHWFWAKMIALVMATVLGIQTFRRSSRALGVFTLLLLLYVFAVSYQKTPTLTDNRELLNKERKTEHVDLAGATLEEHGKYLFTSMGCDRCHGENGDKGYAGAKDLSKSRLTNDQIKKAVRNGQKNMPAYGKFFSLEELDAVTAYVKSLRTE